MSQESKTILEIDRAKPLNVAQAGAALPSWKLKKLEELIRIYKEDYGASESLARETAWRFMEQLEKELA